MLSKLIYTLWVVFENIVVCFLQLAYGQSSKQRNAWWFNFCGQPKILERSNSSCTCIYQESHVLKRKEVILSFCELNLFLPILHKTKRLSITFNVHENSDNYLYSQGFERINQVHWDTETNLSDVGMSFYRNQLSEPPSASALSLAVFTCVVTASLKCHI